jgi:SOS-response transcriptional repressor LexA
MLDNRAMGNWLEPFLRSAGLSQEQLAEAIGMSRATINRLANDHSKLKLDRAEELAPHLRVSADELMLNRPRTEEAKQPRKGVPIPPGRLPYGGTVEAGDWLTVDDFNQDLADNTVPMSVPRHPGYPQLEQVAWKVRGDSMDQAGILEGMWLVGASYADYVDKVGELDNGNFVVAERTRYQGAERELTVKEVQFARRGMRLVPRSSNPKHKEFFVDLDPEADPDRETVRILGVVLWVGRDLAPGAK